MFHITEPTPILGAKPNPFHTKLKAHVLTGLVNDCPERQVKLPGKTCRMIEDSLQVSMRQRVCHSQNMDDKWLSAL